MIAWVLTFQEPCSWSLSYFYLWESYCELVLASSEQLSKFCQPSDPLYIDNLRHFHYFGPKQVSQTQLPLSAFLKSISPHLWCYRNLAGFKEILTVHLPSLCHSGLVTHSSSPTLDPSLWSFDFIPHWFGFPIFPLQLLAINIQALSPWKSRFVITTVIFKGLLTLVIFPKSGTFSCVLLKLGLLTHLQLFLLLWKSYVP